MRFDRGWRGRRGGARLFDDLAQLHQSLHAAHLIMRAGEADGAVETRDEAVPLVFAVQAERGGFELTENRRG